MSTRPGFGGVETVVQDFAEKLARELPATVASVTLLDQPSSALTLKAVGVLHALPEPPRVGARIHLARAPWHQAVLESQEPIFLDGQGRPTVSLEVNGGWELALQSVYLVPIRIGEETIGVLGVGEMRSSEREAFTEEKRDRCRAILEGFVAASPHVWEAGTLRRQTRAMSSLLRLAQEVMEARSAEEILGTSVAEMSDWLGVPVSGILFRARPDGGMEPVARRGLPEPFSDNDAVQLLLALVRTGVGAHRPVSAVSVADDPLDPFHPAMRPGETWSRVALPLMRADRLLGIACLYVADDLRPSQWEMEAFRRRGELIALALGVVGALEGHRSEQRWLGRAAYHMLTEHQRTALSETVAGILDLVSTDLPPRLARLVPEVEGSESGPGGPVDRAAGVRRGPGRARPDPGAHGAAGPASRRGAGRQQHCPARDGDRSRALGPARARAAARGRVRAGDARRAAPGARVRLARGRDRARHRERRGGDAEGREGAAAHRPRQRTRADRRRGLRRRRGAGPARRLCSARVDEGQPAPRNGAARNPIAGEPTRRFRVADPRRWVYRTPKSGYPP